MIQMPSVDPASRVSIAMSVKCVWQVEVTTGEECKRAMDGALYHDCEWCV